MSDRIEQAARECVHEWYVTIPVYLADNEQLMLEDAIAALIRREREDAARVERESAPTLAGFIAERGVANPCERCDGLGVRVYGSTATWHGGIGGQACTLDVCDRCWGSGDEFRRWLSHREAAAAMKARGPQ
jgi:hypothetical protein